ncbi:MAG: metallophosphoesterase [Syntrophomonadaceae bacterium]
MRLSMLVFFSIFIIIYGLSNYYIALRGWQALSSVSRTGALLWAAGVAFLALLYIIGRFVDGKLPYSDTRAIMLGGSYWMAAWFYFLLLFASFDLLRLLSRLPFIPAIVWSDWSYRLFLASIGLVLILLIWGSLNAWHPVVRRYDLVLPQKSSPLNELHVVAVSDIHLGWVVDSRRLNQLVDKIRDLNPDAVFLVGDVIDEGIDPAAESLIPQALIKVQPPLGSFAILGNHEYISRQAERLKPYFLEGGVSLLRDESVKVADAFYLVGRDDRSSATFNGGARQELPALLTGIDRESLPVILLDHQPFNLHEAQVQGVDLQISGHTHLGQMFPNNLVTRAMYECDWGYLRKENLQVLVSSGYGTWGPPIRIGNRPEILDIYITFAH